VPGNVVAGAVRPLEARLRAGPFRPGDESGFDGGGQVAAALGSRRGRGGGRGSRSSDGPRAVLARVRRGDPGLRHVGSWLPSAGVGRRHRSLCRLRCSFRRSTWKRAEHGGLSGGPSGEDRAASSADDKRQVNAAAGVLSESE